jgi:hypothetical protein
MTKLSLPTPHVPLSWGELIDKITILEIKSARLGDAGALANVRLELARLSEIAGPPLAAHAVLAALRDRLRSVNEALWEVEDAIRDKEAAKEFDDRFVALARAVYQHNDARAAIKREINLLAGSQIVEEKSYKHY